ncbi:septum site-determining protein Ssd [Jongsikchunia kroppenstedtii]|uniref:septum site-determining protein Ssd n=1 Tax=Jongsikchunia kroppenstedtii TaxID=1121721 RepID=UPI00037EEF6C|nr:septum site-determining protein Ssd [Jongsikchunia kroppenstedtii]
MDTGGPKLVPVNPVALVMVNDDLLEDVGRVVAAAGYRLVRAAATDCRRLWSEAGAVLVDADAAHIASAQHLPRRGGVVVVGLAGIEPAPMWRHALSLGAIDAMPLPDDEQAVVRVLTRLRVSGSVRGSAVAVIGGAGGAGATVLAAASAMAAARSGRALLIDADDLGGGVDLLVGLENSPGMRWVDLALEGGRVLADSLHAALPHDGHGLSVLAHARGGRAAAVRPEVVVATIDAGREHGDVVVIDLPHRDDELTAAVAAAVDLVVVVVPATVRGCAAGRETLGRIAIRTSAHAVAVRGPAPGGLSARQVADAVESPLLASYRPDPALTRRIECGPLRVGRRSPLAIAAQTVIARARAGVNA